jgi:hypothetical protein
MRRPATRLAFAVLLAVIACNAQITDPSKTPAAVVLPGLLSVTAPTDAPADGATLIRVQATVDTSLKGDARIVKFSTSAGTFIEPNVRADSIGTAIAVLRAPVDSVTASVVATAGGTARRTDVRFSLARAERIDVDPSAFALEASAAKEITVTAHLRRTTGLASPGALVTFSATDSTGASIGRFSSAAPSGANGDVTARYTAGDTSYRGRVTLTATTTGAIGAAISGSTSIQVVAPK